MSLESSPNNKIEAFQENLKLGQPVMVKLPQIGIVPKTLYWFAWPGFR